MLFEALAGLDLALQPALLMHVLSNLICIARTEASEPAVMLLHISLCFLIFFTGEIGRASEHWLQTKLVTRPLPMLLDSLLLWCTEELYVTFLLFL